MFPEWNKTAESLPQPYRGFALLGLMFLEVGMKTGINISVFMLALFMVVCVIRRAVIPMFISSK